MTGRLDRAPRGKIGTHAAHEPTHHAPAAERIVKAPGAAGAYAREGGAGKTIQPRYRWWLCVR
jgi:hypothetical protein